MDRDDIKGAFREISNLMDENRNYLVELDQQNGDGDLGISMSSGFKAALDVLEGTDELDIGQLFMVASRAFNEAAPSTLGTIITLFLMGIARALKGKTEVTVSELADAMQDGINRIMERAKSKPGEKTILDALHPGMLALKESQSKSALEAFKHAYEKASLGSEDTRNMRSVHGRAAYFAENSIGVLDGGSVAGKFIFEGMLRYAEGKKN